MQRGVAVQGPDIGVVEHGSKAIEVADLATVPVDGAPAADGFDQRGFFLDDVVETDEEVADLLVGVALVVGEPTAVAFVVDAQAQMAEGGEFAGDGAEVLVVDGAVNGEGERDILAVAADIADLVERPAGGVAAGAAFIGEVIIVGIGPGESGGGLWAIEARSGQPLSRGSSSTSGSRRDAAGRAGEAGNPDRRIRRARCHRRCRGAGCGAEGDFERLLRSE